MTSEDNYDSSEKRIDELEERVKFLISEYEKQQKLIDDLSIDTIYVDPMDQVYG